MATVCPTKRRCPSMARAMVCAGALACCSACGDDTVSGIEQPELGWRSDALLVVAGRRFKDLDHDGKLSPFEDWRLPAEDRARDLLSRMSLVEKAGTLVHTFAPGRGAELFVRNTEWDEVAFAHRVLDEGVTSYLVNLNVTPAQMAAATNRMQAVAERSRLGIPITFSSNNRNDFDSASRDFERDAWFSRWPDASGLAATRDPALVRRFADVARQEFLASGLRMAFAPHADLASEPRWTRMNQTFGADPALARALTRAYVEGMQAGPDGVGAHSVVATVKHWAGYGAAPQGYDARTWYGRFLAFPGQAFEAHLLPFTGAFAAHVGAVMPTYGVPPASVHVRGVKGALEQVGAGFSRQMLQELLRGRFGFDGLIVSDFNITVDCGAVCRGEAPAGAHVEPGQMGTPWGVETLTPRERVLRALDAGVDQIGGAADPADIVALVQDGRLSMARVDASVYRVLWLKFRQGLFENPYVDEAAAARIVGGAAFRAEGQAAQRRSLVLLSNRQHVLPLEPARRPRLFLVGIAPQAARRLGFQVVDDPAHADAAVVRLEAPNGQAHPGHPMNVFGPEGSLAFRDDDPAWRQLRELAARLPTVATVYLSRAAVLNEVVQTAQAVIGNFGVDDDALLEALSAGAAPQGRLPYELPSSMAAVVRQLPDVPDDSPAPLFAYGFGLSYDD